MRDDQFDASSVAVASSNIGKPPRQIQGAETAGPRIWSLENASVPEGDIFSRCVRSICSALSSAARYMAQENKDQSSESYTTRLRRESERFQLWGNGHSFEDRDLGEFSSPSTDLGLPVLCRLYELGTVTKECLLPCVGVRKSTVDFPTETRNLEVNLKPILKILQENNQEIIDYRLPNPSKDTSDPSSPLEDIRVLIDCLMDLSLATEDCLATPSGPLPWRQSREELNDPVTQKDKQSTSEGTTPQKADKGKLQAPNTQDKHKKEAAFGTNVNPPHDTILISYTQCPASTAGSAYTQNTQYAESIDEGQQYMYQDLPAHAYKLPCEFYAIGGCETFFDYNDNEAWMEHILVNHLQDKLPSKADCWYCTTYTFSIKDPRVHGDRRLNFQNRMDHIRDHIADGKTANDMMPDFHMLDHLLKHNLVPEERYHEVRRWHGLPTPRDHLVGFYKPKFIPPERQRQAERSNMVQIDHNKEERQRKKDRKKR